MLKTDSENPKIIYVGDPMCSWCYGISDELAELEKAYEGRLKMEVILGGLRPFNSETMLDLKDFLTHHWEDVAKMSGQSFSYGILDSDNITYDTEPPCRATVVVRNMTEKSTLSFFQRIQKDFYQGNKNMHLVESYEDAVKAEGLDFLIFKSKFNSQEMKKAVLMDFQRSQELGVSSFPTVLLQVDGKIIPIAQGYATYEKMKQRIDRLLK